MPEVRSTALAWGTLTSATPDRIFTVPSDRTVLLKSIYGQNMGGANPDILLEWAVPPAPRLPLQAIPTTYGKSWFWSGWIALNPGWELWLTIGTGGAANYIASGAVLPGIVPQLPGTKPA